MRTTDYTYEKAEEICDFIAVGGRMSEFCEREGSPDRVTIFRWRRKNPEFEAMYRLACENRAEVRADEIMSIADGAAEAYVTNAMGRSVIDNGAVQAARLRVDSIKWLMSKEGRYGDKLDVTSNGEKVQFSPFCIPGLDRKSNE